MLAKSVQQLPPPRTGGWAYEPKLDGYRAISIVTDGGQVQIWSRRGARLDAAFPELVAAVSASIPRGTVVDGEIVRWSDNRLDFGALQRRYAQRRRASDLASTQPCHLVLFDVLETRRDGDLRRTRLTARRRILERLFRRVPRGSPLTLGLQTTDVDLAKTWYDDFPAAGIEGLVIKPADSTYTTGRDWLKYKVHRTTDAIFAGVTGSLERPEALLVGRYASDTGQLRFAGRTTPLTDAQAAQVSPHLKRARADHPWPDVLSINWRAEPVHYQRVQPTLVVEIRTDVATDEGHRWRHVLRFLRMTDLAPHDVPLDLDMET